MKCKSLTDILDLRDVSVLDEGVITFRREKNIICGKKILKVDKVITSINELSDNEVTKYLRTYFSSINLGFPIEIKTILTPIDKEKLTSELNRKIQNLLIEVEVNPNNVKAKTELEKLNKLREKILRHGIQPFDLITFYVVEACGLNEEEVLNTLNTRANILRKTLESVGVLTSELRGIEGMALLQIFFRGFTSKYYNLILSKLFRWKFSIKIASPILTIFIPHLIRARTQFDLRNYGVYLGYNLITSEKVFWNIRNCLNPHVLVLGPSGIGKTETLIMILLRTYLTYSTKVFVVDVKNEYKERLAKKGFKPKVVNLGVDSGLGLANVLETLPKSLRAAFLTELLSDTSVVMGEKEMVATIFKVFNEVFELQSDIAGNFWGLVRDVISSLDDEYVQYRLVRLINIVESLDIGVPLIKVFSNSEDINIINFSYASALGIDHLSIAIATLFNVIQMLYMSSVKETHIPRVQVVIDEAWQFMYGKEPLVLKLVRLGRGYGVSIALATQSLYDLGGLGKEFIENVGLFIALPSPDVAYWRELSNYMRISYEDLREYTVLLSRGDALIRILPDPRPIPAKLDYDV